MLGSALVGLVVGIFAGHWLANRWIDHRWYCGHRHRASHPCEPKPEYLKSWRKTEDRLDRAEELEDETKRLRRSWWA